MALESVQIGRVEFSEKTRIDFLEKAVVNLRERVSALEDEVKRLKREK